MEGGRDTYALWSGKDSECSICNSSDYDTSFSDYRVCHSSDWEGSDEKVIMTLESVRVVE